jgi:type I restriction enzyme, S subunit
MGEAGIFQRGKSKHRPRNDPRLFEGGDIPFVQTGDVARSKGNSFQIETYTGYYNEVGLAQSRLWPDGTMCITIAANIAETGFLTFAACIPDVVVAFTPAVDGKTPQFLRMFIELTRTAIEKFAPATAQKTSSSRSSEEFCEEAAADDEVSWSVKFEEEWFAPLKDLETKLRRWFP